MANDADDAFERAKEYHELPLRAADRLLSVLVGLKSALASLPADGHPELPDLHSEQIAASIKQAEGLLSRAEADPTLFGFGEAKQIRELLTGLRETYGDLERHGGFILRLSAPLKAAFGRVLAGEWTRPFSPDATRSVNDPKRKSLAETVSVRCKDKPPELRTFGDLLLEVKHAEFCDHKSAENHSRYSGDQRLLTRGDVWGPLASKLRSDHLSWPGVDRIRQEFEANGEPFTADTLTTWRAKRCIDQGFTSEQFDAMTLPSIVETLAFKVGGTLNREPNGTPPSVSLTSIQRTSDRMIRQLSDILLNHGEISALVVRNPKESNWTEPPIKARIGKHYHYSLCNYGAMYVWRLFQKVERNNPVAMFDSLCGGLSALLVSQEKQLPPALAEWLRGNPNEPLARWVWFVSGFVTTPLPYRTPRIHRECWGDDGFTFCRSDRLESVKRSLPKGWPANMPPDASCWLVHTKHLLQATIDAVEYLCELATESLTQETIEQRSKTTTVGVALGQIKQVQTNRQSQSGGRPPIDFEEILSDETKEMINECLDGEKPKRVAERYQRCPDELRDLWKRFRESTQGKEYIKDGEKLKPEVSR